MSDSVHRGISDPISIASPNQACILLIHGVGSPKAHVLEESVRDFLAASGIHGVGVHEYHWNSLVDQPIAGGEDMNVDASYVGGVIRAIQNAALQPSREGSRVLEILNRLLQYLVAFWPLWLLWKFALSISNASFVPGFVLAHPLRSWFRSLMWASHEVLSKYFQIPLVIKTSGPILHLVTTCWLYVSGAISGLSFLLAAVGRRSFVDQVRRVLLLAMAPIVGFGIVLFSLPLPMILMWYAALLLILTIPYVFDVPEKALLIIVGETIVPLAVGVFFLKWFLEKIIGPALKVVADIFRYVADFSYRQKLDKGLEKKIAALKLGNEATLIVVGHSLGSVVAAHFFLSNPAVLLKLGPVRCVTMGSPLVRFFHRFFPDFCPHPATLMEAIRQTKRDFRWINVYRPWDPIGTSFGGLAFSDIRESSTHQRWRVLLAAHTDYWTDPVVLKTIREELTQAGNPNSRPIAPVIGEARKLWFCRSPDRGFPPFLLNRLALGLAFLVVGWMYFSTLYTVPRLRREFRSALVERIDRDFVEEVGAVSVQHMDIPNPLDTTERYPVCGYTVTYAIQNSPRPAVSKVFGHLRSCDAKPPTSVVLRYSRADPTEFYVVSEKEDLLPGGRAGDIVLLTAYAAPILGLLTFFSARSALRVCLGIGR